MRWQPTAPLIISPLLGANPKRPLIDNHLVYWIGPIIGAVIAATLYNTVFIKKD